MTCVLNRGNRVLVCRRELALRSRLDTVRELIDPHRRSGHRGRAMPTTCTRSPLRRQRHLDRLAPLRIARVFSDDARDHVAVTDVISRSPGGGHVSPGTGQSRLTCHLLLGPRQVVEPRPSHAVRRRRAGTTGPHGGIVEGELPATAWPGPLRPNPVQGFGAADPVRDDLVASLNDRVGQIPLGGRIPDITIPTATSVAIHCCGARPGA